jgi:2-pyrone-4,6-dicarboxylate lactonase
MTGKPPAGMFHADMARVLATSLEPGTPLPAGAWDCHSHVFGPFHRFPLQEMGAYSPPLSPADEYVGMLDRVGFSHAVVVQPAAYGYDNAALLDALARYPDRLRGIAVIDPDTPEEVLRALHRAGIRGVRVTESIGGRGLLGSELLRLDHLEIIAPKLARVGMHIQIWAEAKQIAEESERLAQLPLPVVLDHFGQIDVTKGVDGECFQALLRLFKHPHIWAKIQPLRLTHDKAYRSLARPFFELLVEAAPDRLLWGTDWPFIAMGHDLPNPGSLIDELREWADEDTVHAILIDNPARLYT